MPVYLYISIGSWLKAVFLPEPGREVLYVKFQQFYWKQQATVEIEDNPERSS